MSSPAAKVVLVCALVFVWVSSWGQLRSSPFDDPITTSWSEIDHIEDLHKSQQLCVVEMASCPLMELAPDYAALAETTAQNVGSMFRVEVSKRGPPSINS